ncbi:MAG: DUF4956 domain-containing protein [Planctomycetes bacterium]|jgi:uncharacterized membrane protein YhiD involved in acid resistance|nr:DUF4956 domain-containing protein [Planctomycetota bacterium]MBT4028686.1 DUF4956 domain-containing protein [Planctomycetota bacterium]MBT4560100.1 DUF4956 domain-containing protein [Planctomycetota bacterium]MBT5102252.1 DUF4956 domain-containing protein [Planctomycetota bacterium]MBT5120494.1 DUF4956 domain-containing protein [Planctomycetota bacterium]
MGNTQDFLRMLAEEGNWAPAYTPAAMALSLLLAFVLGQFLAWIYVRTHSGLSYSRTFTQSLVLMNMVVALVMFVIGNSIVTAFGLIGALAIIRFRNVLKDTRDTVFVFFTLVLGMACGSQRYLAAILGTVFLATAVVYLHFTKFGSLSSYDGHLNCRLGRDNREKADTDLLSVIKTHCQSSRRVSVREAQDGSEYVFQVRLRDPSRSGEFLDALYQLAGIGEVGLILRDEHSEI